MLVSAVAPWPDFKAMWMQVLLHGNRRTLVTDMYRGTVYGRGRQLFGLKGYLRSFGEFLRVGSGVQLILSSPPGA